MPGVKAAYAASKAGVSSLGESLRAEYASGPIKVTLLEPGYIESEMTARSNTTMLMVDNETGVDQMVKAIERETGRAIVPGWPWVPLVTLLKLLPPRFTNPSPECLPRADANASRHAAVSEPLRLLATGTTAPYRAPRDSGAPARRWSCRSAWPANRHW